MNARNLCLPLLFLPLLPAGTARACTVPVFRYSLERWRPSPYEVIVFHRGKLPASAERMVRKLQRPALPANLTVKVVDLDGQVAADQALVWKRESARAVLPWLVSLYPDEDEVPAMAWAGRLTEANVALLLDSPVRRRLIQHLARGESAVWLVLESGDARADQAALDLLRRELARLQKTLKAPDQDEGTKLLTELPLRISFQVLSVSRSAPAEQGLVRMLLNLDPKMAGARGPIVFPVIGRGRALVGLHGAKLTALHIEDWAGFLCGACSCQAKEENPGTDLLLSANWEALLGPLAEDEDRPASVVAQARAATFAAERGAREVVAPRRRGRNRAVEVAIPPGAQATAAEVGTRFEGDRGRWWWVGGGLAGVVALLAGARAWRTRPARGEHREPIR